MFIENLRNTLNDEKQLTENGALGYKTSGHKLVDLNFRASTLRYDKDEEIKSAFLDAFAQEPEMAIKWLFFARDIREGMGERRVFRVIIQHLCNSYPDQMCEILEYIPEYGRWDDLIYIIKRRVPDKIFNKVVGIIVNQLREDMENALNGKNISLLAKWMPSEKSHNKEARNVAYKAMSFLGLTPRNYRKMISGLRKTLDVVERKMSANEWSFINYSSVPSNANLKYRNAFNRHDHERYNDFLTKVLTKEAKINSSTLYPHEIVKKYRSDDMWGVSYFPEFEPDLEALWKSLPRDNSLKDTIVVSDGSGSMYTTTYGVQPIDVAQALAIYFSETCQGEFKNKYITFSQTPQLVDFGKADNLLDKLKIIDKYNEVANTDIEAVFDLILKVATDAHMAQEEIPKNILIISDMEFDMATHTSVFCDEPPRVDKTLYDSISEKYHNAGYEMPKLIFWNVLSRTNTIPLKENDLGVALLSGYSPAIADMIMSGRLDPYSILIEKLNSERYKDIKFKLL